MDSNRPPSLKHDDREIDVRSIARISVIVVAVTGAALAGTWLFTRSLTEEEIAGHAVPPPIAQGAPTTPVEPRLQPSPPEGLKRLREEEERVLKEYEWVDKPAGVVGIPIDLAIELVAKRGLPARPAPPPATTITTPTQSSLHDARKEPAP